MGKLAVRIAAAVILAAALFWTTRSTSGAALSLRHVLHSYISLSVVAPGRAVTMPAKQKPAIQSALRWPVTGSVTLSAGGIAIAAPSGALVRAAGPGKVVSLTSDPPGVDVKVRDGSLTLTYGHVGPVSVRLGQLVRAGEVIGEIPHFGPGQAPTLIFSASRRGRETSVLALLGAP